MSHRLKDCRSVEAYIRWLQSKGVSPGENAFAGLVYPVHTGSGTTWSSLHYRTIKDGKVVVAEKKLVLYQGRQIQTPQGKLGTDINDRGIADNDFSKDFKNETEVLTFLYFRTLGVFGPDGYDVLDEMFFGPYGFLKEDPDRNRQHPVPGHADHLHAGFKKLRW